jgi:hypothetical protein
VGSSHEVSKWARKNDMGSFLIYLHVRSCPVDERVHTADG